MRILFPDTNLFVQCRDLRDLPWSDVSGDEDEILLVVSRPVQEEIDRLKYSGQGRRSKRARTANTLFRQMFTAPDETVPIQESNPAVKITFAAPVATSAFPEQLDPSHADDRIVGEALVFRQESGASVALLTHDTNPLLTARRCGLDTVIIPDSWLLEPEPDSRDKRIRAIDERVRALEQQHPQIAVERTDSAEPTLAIEVALYEDIAESDLQDLVTRVRERYPEVVDDRPPDEPQVPGSVFQPPSDREIKEYREHLYPAWLEQVEEFFRSLPSRLTWSTRRADVTLTIANTGHVSAERLLVEFEVSDGITIAPERREGERPLPFLRPPSIPAPPEPPRGSWRIGRFLSDLASSLNQASRPAPMRGFPQSPSSISPRRRDRHGFYWKPECPKAPTSRWVLECEEFRHQLEPEVFSLTLLVVENPSGGRLRCRCTAQNSPEPTVYQLPVKVVCSSRDSVAEARLLIETLDCDSEGEDAEHTG